MQIASLLKAHATDHLGVDPVGVCRAADLDDLESLYVGWTLQQRTVRLRELLPDVRSVVVLGYHVWDSMHELALRSARGWLYPGYFPLEAQAWALALWLERWGYSSPATSQRSVLTPTGCAPNVRRYARWGKGKPMPSPPAPPPTLGSGLGQNEHFVVR